MKAAVQHVFRLATHIKLALPQQADDACPVSSSAVSSCVTRHCWAFDKLQALQNVEIGTTLHWHCITECMCVATVDNDLMTPSFKLKRPQLQKHYQKQIDEMYKEAKKGM